MSPRFRLAGDFWIMASLGVFTVTVKLLFLPLRAPVVPDIMVVGLGVGLIVFVFEFRLDLEKGERGRKLLNMRDGLNARSLKLFFGVFSSSVRVESWSGTRSCDFDFWSALRLTSLRSPSSVASGDLTGGGG